jgi:dipeptidase
MCDTFIASPKVTTDNVMVFAKNSDREPNEAHYIELIPAADHPKGSRLKCTYMEIPQVEHTHTVLLAKPFWIWGAEMGVNEHSLAIGNEAIFSKISASKEPKLLGMDLLRLGLERASTAKQAVRVITDLLTEYGQGGNGEFERELAYHNSYLIADPHEAWVLETVDSLWAAKQVSPIYSISNGLTITSEWDLSSSNLVEYAERKGWHRKNGGEFNLAKSYSDYLFTTFSGSFSRRKRTMDILEGRKGEIDVFTALDVLRDHGEGGGEGFRPDRSLTRQMVCAHANFGPIRISQSTGSLVACLQPDSPAVFFTGTAAPCTSIFKPVWLDIPLPDMGPTPSGVFNPETLFWKHELLHRATLRDYPTLIQVYQAERDQLERRFVDGALSLHDGSASQRAEFSQACFRQAEQAEDSWLESIQREFNEPCQTWYHRLAWRNMNRSADVPVTSM